MRLTSALIIILGLAASSTVWAQKTAPVVEEVMIFSLENAAEGGFNRLKLSADIYSSVYYRDFRDLQVVDGQGRPVPSILIQPKASVETKPGSTYDLPFYPINISRQGAQPAPLEEGLSYTTQGGILEFKIQNSRVTPDDTPKAYIIDASQPAAGKVPSESLRLHFKVLPEEKNKAFRLQLKSSPDLRQWRTLASDLTVLLTPDKDGGVAVINLDGEAGPYLSLAWLDGESPPALDQVTLTSLSTTTTPGVETLTKKISGQLTFDENNQPQLDFFFPGRLPVTGLNLILTQPASFDSNLLARDQADQPWQSLGRLKSYLIVHNGQTELNPTWETNRADFHYYRFTPQGFWPAFDQAPELEIEYTSLELGFFAQGGGPYQLIVGQHSPVPKPQMPPETTFGPDGPSGWPLVQISSGHKPTPTAPATATIQHQTWMEKSGPWIFRGVLIIGIVGMLFAAFRLYRQLGRSDKQG